MLQHFSRHFFALVSGVVCMGAGMLCTQPVQAQSTLGLKDLSPFKSPGKTWAIAGGVAADFSTVGHLAVQPGEGVLVNRPEQNNGADLFTAAEYGDMDLELDYLLPKGSNSGIYLQGRYEIQLMDSWGITTPTAGDNGGIYQRWDDSKPEGQKGYDGHAPRLNVTRAPGLWQHLKISFQAPRFDASGKKIENARILRAELNGVTIHEDVELSGPTRGSVSAGESKTGPLRIQGDHGAIALRNIKITPFDKPRPEFSNVRYAVYKGRYTEASDLAKLPPEAQGPMGVMSASVLEKLPEQYFIKYTGTVKIAEPGSYGFNALVPGGRGILKINNQSLGGSGRGNRNTIDLPAGELPFEMLYVKNQDWTNRALSLMVAGPGIREFVVGDPVSGGGGTDPIYVDAPVNTMLRSFMDIPGGKRVVHAISVGSPKQVHFTYDLDKGALLQTWRGGFLDATPMWYSRGDGSSRPRGTVQFLGAPVLAVARLESPSAAWPADTTGSGYTPKGYSLDKNDLPAFSYAVYGTMVEDAVKPLEGGEGIRRTITVQNPGANLYVRLAEGTTIEPMSENVYVIDGRKYYLRLDDAAGAKAIVREANGKKEVLVPLQNKISYSILF